MFFTFFNFLYKLMIGSGSGNWFGGFRIRNTGTWNFDGINLIKSVLNLTCFFSSAFSISFFITEKRKWCSCSYWRTFFSVPLSEKIIIIRESYLFASWKLVGISLINLVPPSIGAARRWVSERWCRRSSLCCGPGTRAQRWGAAAAARQPRVSGEGEGLPAQGGEGRGQGDHSRGPARHRAVAPVPAGNQLDLKISNLSPMFYYTVSFTFSLLFLFIPVIRIPTLYISPI